MRYVLFLLILIFISCKTKPNPAVTDRTIDFAQLDNQWKKVDSLEQKGLISSALDIVRDIQQQALAASHSAHLVKSVVYENKFLNQLEEDAAIKVLQRIEAGIQSYPEPAKSVMHSLAAQWYLNYLQNQIWQLRNRTEFSGEPGPDIRTWGIRHFIDRIQHHFKQSVSWDGLKAAPVEDYELILTDKQGTDDLRPSLYDILMHRAIDYFSGTQSFLTQPAYQFILTDERAFAEVDDFIRQAFVSQDSVSATWITLQWYQELLAFRISDKNHEAALVDADLKRLRFVYDHIIHDQKDSLYRQSLEKLLQKHSGNAESALVSYHLAELLSQLASQWSYDKKSPYRMAYREAIAICRQAIEKYPDAYGSQLCKNLIAQIESKSISAAIESINLPGEPLLAQLEYRNLDKVYLKLIKLPEAPRRWREENRNNEDVLARLNQINAMQSWEQVIDDGDDYQVHSTELPIQALPLGHYAVVISDKSDFNPGTSTSGTILFTVSELGYWYIDTRQNEQVAAIVNRKTGQPVPNAKVEFYTYAYVSGRIKAVEKKIGEALSDAQGWVNIPVQQGQSIAIRVTKGDDELFESESYYVYRSGQEYDANPTTLFFTDRAIYRPGQKVYFKGYVLNFDKYSEPKIVPRKNVEVTLYDVNGQEQLRKNFTTNDFGTLAGHFDLPSGSMTGQMSIASSYGDSRHYFQVEEYKRPKFEIVFDTIKETVSLNENVTIRGKAMDYAGSPVSGAQVQYRVERATIMPWYRYYSRGFWPREDDRQLLTTGQSVTDAQGNFTVTFLALPKPGGEEDLLYNFETTVFVTDVTGESHELTKSVLLNQQGYQVMMQLPEKILKSRLSKVPVTAQNSDGNTISITGDLKVSRIKGPSQHKRNRLWEKPDVLTIDANTYASNYPHYFIPGKEEMQDWEVLGQTGSQRYTVSGSDSLNLSTLFREAGFYKLDWTWRDSRGKELPITQYIMVYEDNALLPGYEPLEVNILPDIVQPGKTLDIDLLTGLKDAPKVIRIIERRKVNPEKSWKPLPLYDDKTIKITEADRGGIYLHHLVVYNNRFIQKQQSVSVPWSNKELDVALKTWRNKMEPGDEEAWTLTVKGSKGDAVTAEMLLSMYDASLDAFLPHQWQMSLYPSFSPRVLIQSSMTQAAQYWGLTHHWQQIYHDVPFRQYRDIDQFGYYPEGFYGYPRRFKDGREMDVMVESAAPPMAEEVQATGQSTGNVAADESQKGVEEKKTGVSTSPPLRSVLDETVFFYPQMTTDEAGHLSFTFRMKEGLTRWKFQALGHTKDLAFGLTEAEAVTQKQLMIFPNPPRFFREKDTIDFQAKVTNLTAQQLTGTTTLKIIDAVTGKEVSSQWKLGQSTKSITIGAQGSSPVAWTLAVPPGWINPVSYQVSVSAGAYTDGEESMLPVVTNRILITETLPLPVKANETRTFVFESMKNRSSTLEDHRYTIEMTSSPAWYAVQALPYLMEYPHECAEQIFSRLYANTLAAHIVQKNPSIKKVYDTWRATNDDALLSNLQKNEELRNAMLEETPWVRDALGETAQKKDIALLFETNRLRNEAQQAITMLQEMQLGNGAFPWFPGGTDNWYITQYIVEGFGHLKKLGAKPAADPVLIIDRAIPYLDGRIVEWHEELLRLANQGKIKLSDHQIGPIQVHFLYTRSFYPEFDRSAKLNAAVTYIQEQMQKYWLQHSIYEQGLMALGMYRFSPNNPLSKEILASLREKTIYHEELGRYWKINSGWFWYEAPVEMQSLMIELYQEMKVGQSETDELRVWLLKHKQTNRWNSTKSTAAAIYALLIHPDAWLDSKGIVEVRIGGQKIFDETSAEPGTGYLKQSWDGDAIKSSWSTIEVKNPNNHIAWGSAYWQYWEDIDQVVKPEGANALNVSRQLLIAGNTDRGEQSQIADASGLKVGDKLLVRLIIETDRAMEYVHLKDVRASGFEPMDVISGFEWNGRLGYYQSTRDLATHFFIDYLPRGKYVIEYPVTVAQAGHYSEGLAQLQCMYAPEFSDHSQGQRVVAERN